MPRIGATSALEKVLSGAAKSSYKRSDRDTQHPASYLGGKQSLDADAKRSLVIAVHV